jgi:hypothetical protein
MRDDLLPAARYRLLHLHQDNFTYCNLSFHALARYQSKSKHSEGAWSGHYEYKHDSRLALQRRDSLPALPLLPDLVHDV